MRAAFFFARSCFWGPGPRLYGHGNGRLNEFFYFVFGKQIIMPYFYPALPAAHSHNFFTAVDGQAVNDPSGPKDLPGLPLA
jgi:hypothetical protein